MEHDFFTFARALAQLANQGQTRRDFLCEASQMLLALTGCDEIELRGKDGRLLFRWEFRLQPGLHRHFEILTGVRNAAGRLLPCSNDDSAFEQLCCDVLSGSISAPASFLTEHGSFWTGDTSVPVKVILRANASHPAQMAHFGKEYQSLALIPFALSTEDVGLLHLKSRQPLFFTLEQIVRYEEIAQTLGMAMATRRTQAALHERNKELKCLYGIMQVAMRPEGALEEILQGIVRLLPPAMQHPECAAARIIFDKNSYLTRGFQESTPRLAADIVVGGLQRGSIAVTYWEEKDALESDTFLEEEQSLLDAVASQIALIIARQRAEREKAKLQEQLRHADRLATIGQLAAGIAHELNEPLANILGFAQLARKAPELPRQTEQDIEKIVASSLHAREIIKKLLTFARQVPPSKSEVDLNQLVTHGLYFLEARFAKQGVTLELSLTPNLPKITADATQLQQVLVNLAVNSLHAMPEGGCLTIKTLADEGHVTLVVADTGIGMSEEVKQQLFLPFFTTKDVGQGTGLGLPVVHGIVTSHGGTIHVNSELGHGARFTIKLPIGELPENEKSTNDEYF